MVGMFANQAAQSPFGSLFGANAGLPPPYAPASNQTVQPLVPTQPMPVGLGMGAAAQPQPPHGFNAPGGWADKLGGIGALLLSAGGNPAGPQMFDQIQQRRQEDARRQQALAAMFAPQHVGDAIVHLDPATRKYVTDYAPQTAPKVGPLQQKIDDLKANGATAAQINALIAAESNPLTWLRGENGDGTVTMTPVPRGAPVGVPTGGPAPGTIDGQYRFKGGDYKNPSNWELIGGAGSQAPRTFR